MSATRTRRGPAPEWTVADVVAYLGERGAAISPATWRSYVARGHAPGPTRHLDRRTPVWDPAVVRAWQDARPGRGAPGVERPSRRRRAASD